MGRSNTRFNTAFTFVHGFQDGESRIHKGSDGSILKEARWTWRLGGSPNLCKQGITSPTTTTHEVLFHDDDARFIQTISYNEARQFPPRLRVLSTRNLALLFATVKKKASGYQPFFLSSFFLSSLSIQRRGQTRNKHVHTDVRKYIHEHTQGVESLWGGEGVK